MLLFGLFGAECLSGHLARPRLDAENPTLSRGLCWYAVPISHDILIYHGLYLGITIIWTPSRSLCWCIPSGICATDLNFSGRECRGLWHLALALFWRWLCSQSLRFKATVLARFMTTALVRFIATALDEFQKGFRPEPCNSRSLNEEMAIFGVCAFDLGAK